MGMASPTVKKEFFIREKNIPQKLRDLPHWVIWRYERAATDAKDAKPRKMPYYPDGGKRGGILGGEQDVARLQSFRQAIDAAKRRGFDGVGLAILPQQDITVIDLDNCISDEGVYSDFANELIQHGSYVERSPSGRGLRAVYDGALIKNQKRNFHIDNGERVEVYCGKAYTTFTGNKLPSIKLDDIRPLPKPIKRKLLAGMGDPHRATDSGQSGGDDALLAMSAAPVPNMTPGQAARILDSLPERWGASGEGTWYQVAAALHMQFDGSEEAYAVLDKWSQSRDGYDEASNRARWQAGFSHARGKQNVTSMRNLVFEARDAGCHIKPATMERWGLAKPRKDETDDDDDTDAVEEGDDAKSSLAAKIAAAWTPVDISAWGVPERPVGAKPLVRNWLYEGSVALFSSHGGGGKSYVMLTFCALAVVGGNWFGEKMEAGKCLLVNGEDPLAEVHHRLWGICSANNIDIEQLIGRLDIVDVTSLLHKAMYTAGSDFGKTEFTKQYKHMRRLIETGGYRYLVLDNISKFYMANENARPMVDEFISALAALAASHGVGVVLVGHDSKLGAAGQGYSGSTAWHNSARARWALTVKDGNRDLIVEKNNYGAAGHGGRWLWDETFKIIRMQDAIGAGSAAGDFHDEMVLEFVRDSVVELYAEGGSTWVNKKGRIGPIEEHPRILAQQLTQAMLREALERCVEVGMLGIETSKDRQRRPRQRYCPTPESII
jgi:AAA domain/Primase C terminal 2 (PriCT-2)